MKYNYFNIYLTEADYTPLPKEKKSIIASKTLELQKKIKVDFLKEINHFIKSKEIILENKQDDLIVRVQILAEKENQIMDDLRKLSTTSILDKDYNLTFKNSKLK